MVGSDNPLIKTILLIALSGGERARKRMRKSGGIFHGNHTTVTIPQLIQEQSRLPHAKLGKQIKQHSLSI